MATSITLPKVVGIGGKRRHGKDAAAELLASRFGYVIIGCSDVLDHFARIQNPIVEGTRRYVDVVDDLGFVAAKKHPEVLNILIKTGEALRTTYVADIIANYVEQQILDHLAAGRPVIVTGIRFLIEVALIERLGGITIYVIRPTEPVDTVALTENSVASDDFMAVLMNDGSLEDLAGNARDILTQNWGLAA